MKRFISLLTLLAILISCVGLVSAANEGEENIAIVKDGKAEYAITYSHVWIQQYWDACYELIDEVGNIIEDMTGVKPDSYEATEKIADKEIYIGYTNKLLGSTQKQRVAEGADFSFDKDLLGEGGFIIRRCGDRIVIIGGSIDSTWEAVNYFFVNYMGYDASGAGEKVSTLTVPGDLGCVKSEYYSSDVVAAISVGDAPISDYKVVVAADASDKTVEAADNIRRAVYAISGVSLELVKDDKEATGKEIIVGSANRADMPALADGEYQISSDGARIIISGSTELATEFAADKFISDVLGVSGRSYSGNSIISIPADMMTKAELPFAMYKADGADYPSYIRDNTAELLGKDICYSDGETANKLYEALKTDDLKAGDEVFIISNTNNYCTCDNCKGGTAAFFETVNKVAEKFAADGVTVSTLAYRETRKPTVEKMADNVRVYFAEPEICCAHALNDSSCESNAKIDADLVAWTGICDDVYVLDFTQNYFYYPATFPSIGVIRPNIAHYHDIGVKGVLMEWEKNSALLEFAELRYRLINAVLLDPDMTDEEYNTLFADTMTALYTKNAEKIGQYIDKFTAAAAEHFTIRSKPSEILPIKKTGEGGGAEAYDLTVAKELGQIWEDVYYRHEPPQEEMGQLAMRIFKENYVKSDYYLPLHTRVQFSRWIEHNVPAVDRTAVYQAIIDSFEK